MEGSEVELVVYADGASRGNPGPAAAGYAIFVAGRRLEQGAEHLGETTNNMAEYRAVLLGLRRAAARGRGPVRVRTDSQLVVRQMCGEYRVRSDGLLEVHREVREAGRRFAHVTFEHVPRDDPCVRAVHALLERRLG